MLQNPGSYDECIPIGDFSFDPHKIICCSLESGNILSHGSGGKGYGLATTAITSGCFIWKVRTGSVHRKKVYVQLLPQKSTEITCLTHFSPQFYITKENRGNEGTCIGVSRWPVRDHNHHTTTDMWLYRAYSGNLYHGGELVRTLPSFTQGDTITCILDMEAHTISFAKNDKVCQIFSQYPGDFTLIYWCVFPTISACLCFSVRSQSWHLKVLLPLNSTPVCCSTAVILERRYLIYCKYYRHKFCVGISLFFPPNILVMSYLLATVNKNLEWEIKQMNMFFLGYSRKSTENFTYSNFIFVSQQNCASIFLPGGPA